MTEDAKPTGMVLELLFYSARITKLDPAKSILLGFPLVNKSPKPQVLSWGKLLSRYTFF